MLFASGNKIAASAVKSLRDKSLLDEVPKTEIARKTGVSRNSVAKRLKSGDMKISVFLDTASAVGADPLAILRKAMEGNASKSSRKGK